MSERGCLKDVAFEHCSAKHAFIEHNESALSLLMLGMIPVTNSKTSTVPAPIGAGQTYTAIANTFHQIAYLGDFDWTIILPPAIKNTVVVFNFSGQCDGTNNLIVKCAGIANAGRVFARDHYENQVLNFKTPPAGIEPLSRIGQAIGTKGLTFPIGGATGELHTDANGHVANEITRSDNTITIPMSPTHNQTNVGAELSFYCFATGYWTIFFIGSVLGDGRINGGTVAGGGFVGSFEA